MNKLILDNQKIKRIRRPKHDLEYIKQQFKKNGDVLLSKAYTGNKQRLNYKCNGCGKNRNICYNNYYRGIRCKHCAIHKKVGKGDPRRLTFLDLKDRLYHMSQTAQILNIHYDSLRRFVLLGRLPEGSVQIGCKLYYTEKDIEKIRKMII